MKDIKEAMKELNDAISVFDVNVGDSLEGEDIAAWNGVIRAAKNLNELLEKKCND